MLAWASIGHWTQHFTTFISTVIDIMMASSGWLSHRFLTPIKPAELNHFSIHYGIIFAITTWASRYYDGVARSSPKAVTSELEADDPIQMRTDMCFVKDPPS
jgi:hypothetical protein